MQHWHDGVQYSLTFVGKKKKKTAKRWPCYFGELKLVNIGVFPVWKPFDTQEKKQKKKSEGQKRHRESV